MNFILYYISRIFALAFVMLLFIGIASTGVAFREKRFVGWYQMLGEAVADPGTARISWVMWPPQAMLRGSYHGHPFRYWQIPGGHSHLTLECRVPRSAAYSRVHPHAALTAAERDDLNRRFPNWLAVTLFDKPVAFFQRSMDRRPLGFGNAPGADLYRKNNAPFNAPALRADLEQLSGYCAS